MIDVMLDIETLGVGVRAAVLSAGAVTFNPVTGKIGEKELFLFDPTQQPERNIEFRTMVWWMEQSDEAKAHWKNANFPRIGNEVNRFCNFGTKFVDSKWWACGPHFDMSITESLLADEGMSPPWKFWNVRDTRTIRDHIHQDSLPKNEGAHDPIADCLYQIAQVVEFNRVLRQERR